MRLHHHRSLQYGMRDRIGDGSGHVGGIDTGDDAAAQMPHQWLVDRKERTWRDGEIAQSAIGRDREHLVEDLIAVAEMVVKRQRVAVPDLTRRERLADSPEQLAFARGSCAHPRLVA